MKFYLSDLHLAHSNIIPACSRPFSTVEEMDHFLIQAWHDRLRTCDEIFVVGDLMFLGNHDFWTNRVPKPDRFFISLLPVLRTTDGGKDLLLCHDPAQGLSLLGPNETLIYGHIHNNTNRPYEAELRRLGDRALNCGADITGFRPVTLDELIQCNRAFRAAHPAASVQEV